MEDKKKIEKEKDVKYDINGKECKTPKNIIWGRRHKKFVKK